MGAESRTGSEIQGLSWEQVELLVAKQCVQGEVVDEARAASQALRRA